MHVFKQPLTDAQKRSTKNRERLTQILRNYLFPPAPFHSMLPVQIPHKCVFLANPDVCFTLSRLAQAFAPSIPALNISEVYFLHNGAGRASGAPSHLGDKVLNN